MEWVTSESTTVRNNRYYRFRFIPDSSKYDEATGTIRVRVDGDDNGDENVYLEIDFASVKTGTLIFSEFLYNLRLIECINFTIILGNNIPKI